MKPTLSLCMICKADDNEAKLLDRCLSFVAPYVQELCITITGKNKSCEKVAKAYKAKISHFKWVGDFANARNFNFSQATSDYILWLDADDVLKGADKLQGYVKRMKEEHIDTLIMNYLYDFDEYKLCTVKHLKTRIVKNDGCVRWVGAVHEDFMENRTLNAFMVKDVEVLHLTDRKRAEVAAHRNTEIALKVLKDKPQDPRNLWLVANAYRGEGDKRAKRYYKKFIKLSHSIDEKYLAYINLSELSTTNEWAIKYALQALNLRPAYPNSYFKLALYTMRDEKWETAQTYLELGLQLPIPDTKIIVYNPRDYDYNPLSLLMSVFVRQGKFEKALLTLKELIALYPNDPKLKDKKQLIEKEARNILKIDQYLKKAEKLKGDKLKAYLDKLPEELRSHPKVCYLYNQNFAKKESSGKDVVFFCSFTSKAWNPDIALTDGVGGSEEAIINLSRELVKLGWNVTVYNNCQKEGDYEGVKYRWYWKYNIRDAQDITVFWRHPRPVEYEPNSKVVCIDLHDVIGDAEFTKERLDKIDCVFTKTKAHRTLFPSIPNEKIAVIPNGLNPEMFDLDVKRNPFLILNTSSPDRSLEAVIRIFKKLHARDNRFRLAWYYGWGVYDGVHAENQEMKDWKSKMVNEFEELKIKGIAEGGTMINHKEIAKKYLEAGVLLYPTQFYEIHCCTGNTLIEMPRNHKEYPLGVPIKDLVGKVDFPVYSYDEKNDRIVLGKVNWVSKTRENAPIWRLTLDDGNYLEATEDHQIMLRDGSYKALKELKKGESLMPVYMRANFMIKQNDGNWENEHRLVGEWMAKRKLTTNEHVNHLDDSRYDNRPEMLEILTASQHFSKTHKGRKQTKQHIEKAKVGWLKWSKSKEGKKYHSQNGTKRANKFWKITFPSWTKEHQQEFIQQRVHTRLYNHKVVSVVNTGRTEDVYDMEVEKYHNFGANGIIVHNCISAAKAQAAGCIPVTSDFAALNETVQYGHKIHTEGEKWGKDNTFGDSEDNDEKYIEAILKSVNADDYGKVEMKQWAKDTYAWEKIAMDWNNQFKKLL